MSLPRRSLLEIEKKKRSHGGRISVIGTTLSLFISKRISLQEGKKERSKGRQRFTSAAFTTSWSFFRQLGSAFSDCFPRSRG